MVEEFKGLDQPQETEIDTSKNDHTCANSGAELASDSDSDSDADSLTMSLERIGVNIPSFMIPKLDIPTPSSVSKRINDYLVQSVHMEKSSSSNISEILGLLINKRTSDLKNLYSEVSESLTGILNTNIDHPVEDYIEQLQNEDLRMVSIDKDYNGIDKDNDHNIRTISGVDPDGLNELKKYESLTCLTFEQFQDQNFLRHRIRKILNLEIPPIIQRLLIQKLMSRSFIEKQKHIKLQTGNNDILSEKKQYTDTEYYDNDNTNNENDDEDDDTDENDEMEDDEVFLTLKDKEPTYFSIEQDILGCEHYQRNCKIECSACHKWYTCRFCHDLANPSHPLEREKIKHILCMYCFTPQHPQQYCIECNKELSTHYCSKCKLYDNDPMKNIYHCDKCGICRLGMGLNQDYFHCDSCNACISIDLQKNHVCIENSTKSNCPICDEFMFSSNEKVVFMSCGHPIHEKCYGQHTIHSYKCPTCSKTVVNMELQFRMIDNEIKQSKMPDEMRNWVTEVKCIDCGGMSRVPFHYLGHKCDHCHSYNTMQIKLVKGQEETDSVIMDENTANKLSAAEQLVTDSLKQNFEFAQAKVRLTNKATSNEKRVILTDDDQSIDHDYVDNFIKVINNFEAYSSIGDAFRDWINITLNNISDSDSDPDSG